MRRFVVCVLCVAAPTLLAGCGGKSETPSATQTPTTQAPAAQAPPTSTPPPAATATASKFDAGPRAGEAPMDGGLASKGEKLFQAKGCAVCHGFGKKITCPDLVGVSMRRTAAWMEQQILHPEVMVKEDPITMDLKKSYALPMTNQNVKPEEARALIEFLKRKDHQAGVTK